MSFEVGTRVETGLLISLHLLFVVEVGQVMQWREEGEPVEKSGREAVQEGRGGRANILRERRNI